jgi:hypothetical protein
VTGFLTVLSPLGTISLIFLFFILARLSQKFGAVTKMAPYYRWLWVGLGFLGIALIAQFLRIGVLLAKQASTLWLDTPAFYLITYHLPMAIGITISLIVTWRYWSWLLTERDG